MDFTNRAKKLVRPTVFTNFKCFTPKAEKEATAETDCNAAAPPMSQESSCKSPPIEDAKNKFVQPQPQSDPTTVIHLANIVEVSEAAK